MSHGKLQHSAACEFNAFYGVSTDGFNPHKFLQEFKFLPCSENFRFLSWRLAHMQYMGSGYVTCVLRSQHMAVMHALRVT